VIAPALAAALSLAAGIQAFEVVPAGPGRQRLDVPPALVSASARGDLADLRLHDRSGEEVPHLVVAPPGSAPRWLPVARIRPIPSVRRKESGAELDLGAAREVAGVRLDVPSAASFLRALRVEGSVDRARWIALAPDAAVYALREGDPCPPGPCPRAESDVVRFEPATVRYLRVVFDDRRAPPLPALRGAAALLADEAPPPAGHDVPLAVSRRESEPGVSRFALVLPGPNLPVRAIRLEVDERHLFRRARVLEARLEGGRLVPHALGDGQLVRTERDGVTVSALRVEIGRPEERELELAVEDGDGDALALRGAVAELAPLPWVFFESAGGAPLVATAGDPGRTAPRYDLEALRPEVSGGPGAALPRARLAGATPSPPAPAPAPALADAGLPGAPLDLGAFRVARTLAAAAPGLAAVRLDAAVLAESPDLADVRIAAPDGRQLPYLAEARPEPLPVPLAPSPPLAGTAAERPGTTVRALPLAHGAAPPSRLVLETSARVFARAVRVYAERSDRPGPAPRPLAEATWSHADPSRPAPPLALPLPAVRAERLLLAVDDGDNAPLPIASARLLLPAWRLRFFHPGPELRLVHGAEGLSAPRYDLALLAPRLRAAPAAEVALGPAPAPARRMPTARAAFWAVLAAAVGSLLLLVARLVRAPPPPAAPPGA
jgi:hypothetical protein